MTNKELSELEWLKITREIILAVEKVPTTSTREEIIKLSVVLLLNNILETEEKFNDSIEDLRKNKKLAK